MIFALDSGARIAGAALFTLDGELMAASYIENPVKKGHLVAECVSMARAVAAWLDEAAGGLGFRLLSVEPKITKAVFEWPRAYLPGKQSGDQNDLLPLPGVACAVAACLDFQGAELITVYPDEWKGGNVDKKVMNDRVWARLTPAEQARVTRRPKGGLDHNCLDAVGIGLHHAGRLDRLRVFA